MGDTAVANSGDPNDPRNYESFDSYMRGQGFKVLSLQELARRWNEAHPDDQIDSYGDEINPMVNPKYGALAPSGTGLPRVFAVLQLVGGGLEFFVGLGAVLAPEPTGVTKVIGAVALVHGVDTMGASIVTIISGDRTATLTERGASGLAGAAGASPQTAATIGVVTDIGIGIGGSFGVGALSKAPGAAPKLVHLTNATAAERIAASQTLGLGKSTLYAGDATLAQAKGWNMVWRTGRPASQMTNAILLPPSANKSFLMVQRIGPFSAWQKANGTVFTAGAGTLNLETGVFTRTGPAVNQLGFYTVDSAIMATARGFDQGLGALTMEE